MIEKQASLWAIYEGIADDLTLSTWVNEFLNEKGEDVLAICDDPKDVHLKNNVRTRKIFRGRPWSEAASDEVDSPCSPSRPYDPDYVPDRTGPDRTPSATSEDLEQHYAQ